MSSAGNPTARPLLETADSDEIRVYGDVRADVSAWAGRVAVLLLSGFHAWLFWRHLVDGRLFESAVATRWLAGVLLTAGFIGLRRLGVPVIRGRQAVVLWLLVALLHAHAVLAPQGTLTERGMVDDAVAAIVLQAASATVLFGTGLLLLAMVLRSRERALRTPAWFAQHAAVAGHPADGWLLLRAPRPPPLG